VGSSSRSTRLLLQLRHCLLAVNDAFLSYTSEMSGYKTKSSAVKVDAQWEICATWDFFVCIKPSPDVRNRKSPSSKSDSLFSKQNYLALAVANLTSSEGVHSWWKSDSLGASVSVSHLAASLC